MDYLTYMRAGKRATVIGLATLMGAVCGQVAAQAPGSRVHTQVSVGGNDIAYCTGTVALTGSSLNGALLNCPVSNVTGASASVQGRTVAPIPFNPNNPSSYRMGEVGSSASITSAVVRWPGNNATTYAPSVSAFAGSQYQDVLMLGEVRPAYMRLQFTLDGALEIRTTHPVQQALFTQPGKAQVSYSVGAYSGVYDSVSKSFRSFEPFGQGSVISDRVADSSGFATPTITSNRSLYGTLQHSENMSLLNPFVRTVSIVLDSEFFDNPVNNGLLLNIVLNTFAYSPARVYYGGPPGDPDYSGLVSADFLSTFSMQSLTAYDANDVDITASAILGFASESMAPVPEPEVFAMLLAGLGLLFVAQRRRRSSGP